jgi:hypothetical protein
MHDNGRSSDPRTVAAAGTRSALCFQEHHPVVTQLNIMVSDCGDDDYLDEEVKQNVDSTRSLEEAMTLESEDLFLKYLAAGPISSFAGKSEPGSSSLEDTRSTMFPNVDSRQICESCHRSRSIYCPTCLKLLIEPPPDQLQLPFHLDIILDDHRECATGVHAKVLAGVSSGSFHCRLFDYDKGQGDELDSYDDHVDGTYLLFPGEDSVPLDTLEAEKVKRLVVLDCKWVRCPRPTTAGSSSKVWFLLFSFIRQNQQSGFTKVSRSCQRSIWSMCRTKVSFGAGIRLVKACFPRSRPFTTVHGSLAEIGVWPTDRT